MLSWLVPVFDLREACLSKDLQMLLDITAKVKVRWLGGLLEWLSGLGCEAPLASRLGSEEKVVLFTTPNGKGGD